MLRLQSIGRENTINTTESNLLDSLMDAQVASDAINAVYNDLKKIQEAEFYAKSFGIGNEVVQEKYGAILSIGVEGLWDWIVKAAKAIAKWFQKVWKAIVNLFKTIFGRKNSDDEVEELKQQVADISKSNEDIKAELDTKIQEQITTLQSTADWIKQNETQVAADLKIREDMIQKLADKLMQYKNVVDRYKSKLTNLQEAPQTQKERQEIDVAFNEFAEYCKKNKINLEASERMKILSKTLRLMNAIAGTEGKALSDIRTFLFIMATIMRDIPHGNPLTNAIKDGNLPSSVIDVTLLYVNPIRHPYEDYEIGQQKVTTITGMRIASVEAATKAVSQYIDESLKIIIKDPANIQHYGEDKLKIVFQGVTLASKHIGYVQKLLIGVGRLTTKQVRGKGFAMSGYDGSIATGIRASHNQLLEEVKEAEASGQSNAA